MNEEKEPKLVIIYYPGTLIEADLIKTMLAMKGIKCFVGGQAGIGIFGRPEISVSSVDQEVAQELISKFAKNRKGDTLQDKLIKLVCWSFIILVIGLFLAYLVFKFLPRLL